MAYRLDVRILLAKCLTVSSLAFAQTLQVVDVTTDPPSPVPGAKVLALYQSQANVPGHGRTFCSGTEYVVAGADGRFELSRGPKSDVRVLAHQSGFARPEKGPLALKWKYFLKSGASVDDQLLHIERLLQGASCAVGEEGITRFVEVLLSDLELLPPSERRDAVVSRARLHLNEFRGQR